LRHSSDAPHDRAVAAAIIPLSLSYIGDKFPYEAGNPALGRFMSALIWGRILSAALGGAFGEHLHWRGIFVLFGTAGLLVTGCSSGSATASGAHQDRHFLDGGHSRPLAAAGCATRPDDRVVEGCRLRSLAFFGASMLERFRSSARARWA